jgi:hypothetical protein
MFLLMNEEAHQGIHCNTCSCLKKERILKWMKQIKLIAHACYWNKSWNVMFFSWVEKKDLLNDIHFKIKT